MRYKIDCHPGFSYLDVELNRGESISGESGSMAWMDPTIEMETSTRGGALAGLKRKVLAGESFFQNTFTASEDGARLSLAPGPAGSIQDLALDGDELYLQKGAYLASHGDVVIDSKFDGLKGFFNEGLFILRCSGTGQLFFNAYGDIQQIDVDGEYIVDNGYAVAWDPSLSYRLTRAKKIRSFLFSDQFLLRFSGKGRVWVQSRCPHAFASWIHMFRPQKKDNS